MERQKCPTAQWMFHSVVPGGSEYRWRLTDRTTLTESGRQRGFHSPPSTSLTWLITALDLFPPFIDIFNLLLLQHSSSKSVERWQMREEGGVFLRLRATQRGGGVTHPTHTQFIVHSHLVKEWVHFFYFGGWIFWLHFIVSHGGKKEKRCWNQKKNCYRETQKPQLF